MAEVDFSNSTAAEEWLGKQSHKVRCAISSRAALRVAANLGRVADNHFQSIVLAGFRAMLTSAVCGLSQTKDASWLKSAAESAAKAARSALLAFEEPNNAEADNSNFKIAELPPDEVLSFIASINSAVTAANGSSAAATSSTQYSAAASTSTAAAASFDAAQPKITTYHFALWMGATLPPTIGTAHVVFLERLNADRQTWRFWRHWYLAMWSGTFEDWDLATEVAKMPDDIWDQGAQAVAARIRRIEDNRQPSDKAPAKIVKAVSETEREGVKQAASNNRDALVLSVAGVLEQLAAFRERVRGLNHLEGDFREELLDFIDALSGKLKSLLRNLPEDDKELEDKQANTLVLWLREFRPLIGVTAAKYVAPQNVAEAAVPTGIILGCTAVGTLVGGPTGGGLGALVGGVVTGHVKPGKAAEEITKQGPE